MQLNPPGLAVAVNERIGDPPSLRETHDTLIQPSCGLAVRSVGADGAETGFGVIEGGAVGVAVGDGGGVGVGGGGGVEPLLRRITRPSSRLAIARSGQPSPGMSPTARPCGVYDANGGSGYSSSASRPPLARPRYTPARAQPLWSVTTSACPSRSTSATSTGVGMSYDP